MKLEEEIKQNTFRDAYHKAFVNIWFTAGWLYARNAAWLKEFGLTPEQFNVLRILRGSAPKPVKLADITARMINRNSNASRLVDKLAQKKLVRRLPCSTNRRQVDISITGKGINLLEKIDALPPVWQLLSKKISLAEARTLNRLLDAIRS
ncbi:MAG: MarR family transcriptional regulator [Cyclobacteriaceae bacterium]|nr:MAG: MarR family transcriptional regulator [Cyclobacteriaceae bacterium]